MIKIDNLLNILTNDYSISYEKAKEKYILEIDSDEARSIVSTLKREIKSLGDVNVGAIEEYDRVKERYEFLNKQKEDLTNAENVLLEIITEMDDIMKDKFSSTFNKIKEAFMKHLENYLMVVRQNLNLQIHLIFLKQVLI